MMALQASQVALQASKMALQPEKWFYSHRQRLYSIQKWFYSPKYGSTAENMAPQRAQIRLAQPRGLGADRHGVG
jgi:hypothetical protein